MCSLPTYWGDKNRESCRVLNFFAGYPIEGILENKLKPCVFFIAKNRKSKHRIVNEKFLIYLPFLSFLAVYQLERYFVHYSKSKCRIAEKWKHSVNFSKKGYIFGVFVAYHLRGYFLIATKLVYINLHPHCRFGCRKEKWFYETEHKIRPILRTASEE